MKNKDKTRLFKPSMLHKAGAVLLLAGMIILAAGVIRIAKINGRIDVSQLTEDTIKDGMYVKGTVSGVGRGCPADSTDGRSRALSVISTASQGADLNAVKTAFITDLAPGTGKYICLWIDEFTHTDLYHYIISGDFTDMSKQTEYQFDAVIRYDEKENELIQDYTDKLSETCPQVFYDTYELKDISGEKMSDYTIEIINIGTRKLLWLYSLPLLLGGAVLLILGGSPFEYKERIS